MVNENDCIIIYKSPIGNLHLHCSDVALIKLSFNSFHPNQKGNNISSLLANNTILELNAYFEGKLKNFSVPLMPEGTDFRKSVWDQLIKITYGKTISYQDIANRLNNPKSVRAVGSSNGTNPIAIIIPCHRAIGNDGQLTGYAGGIDKKKYLLELEAPFKQLSVF
jgi:methylated-DNA-[protein]-cysteine S-methyltransferase